MGEMFPKQLNATSSGHSSMEFVHSTVRDGVVSMFPTFTVSWMHPVGVDAKLTSFETSFGSRRSEALK